ncbi:hypothetical protein [Weeksella virosa]|uniref:Uncharacterized protein n=1 Tax=Weeksella virosa (strain ATCC 43766 / DSM 16922 / JCM 21250 / CCUG 30538 / CDC 9751 / IAM 14551 / NBRC 16016 / NCTC 11634 / CL345/78) TaxID=865938 RepID=F0P2W3_WEEVC|nr:hypothetical protein [Weeksella virosa]ADX66853.1 hypothetical protein Weevi_0127 [Weeksella virosa DSM 16922]MDK7675085.1 hypothetical protein [Weeksella virosa]VEH63423.1 Uncharacterised protein [Weeksella virosa]
MMKLDSKLFKKLQGEKKKADAHAFNVDLAIQTLQNICDHVWIDDSLAGQYEPLYCKVCGKEKEK